jgi:hypothetical protein
MYQSLLWVVQVPIIGMCDEMLPQVTTKVAWRVCRGPEQVICLFIPYGYHDVPPTYSIINTPAPKKTQLPDQL